MVSYCCVLSCKNSKKSGRKVPGISYHCFPAWRTTHGSQMSDLTRRRRMAWVAAVRRADITFDKTPGRARVCSLHFHRGKPAFEMCEWDPDWVPSLNLGNTEVMPYKPSEHEARQEMTHQLIPQVKEEEIEAVIVGEHGGGYGDMEEDNPAVECQNCVQKCVKMKKLEEKIQTIQSDSVTECNFCKLRRDEINRLLEENRALKIELERVKMEEPFLKGNNNKVKYYTGLPDFDTFTVLLNAVKPFLPKKVKFLSSFQMVFLTFIRLRLNLPVKFLIYHFQTNRRTFVMAFTETICALNAHFSHFILWPSRTTLQAGPGLSVETSGDRVCVIVDIFDVSTYQGSKVKYLISITPGNMTFISKGFDDNVSDEHIIENSGILEKLGPGDLVLADRVYKLEKDSSGCRYLAELPKQAAEAKRFPVKKAVLNIRRFAILTGAVPPSLLRPCKGDLTLLDKVVRVCCALTSMWPPKSREESTAE